MLNINHWSGIEIRHYKVSSREDWKSTEASTLLQRVCYGIWGNLQGLPNASEGTYCSRWKWKIEKDRYWSQAAHICLFKAREGWLFEKNCLYNPSSNPSWTRQEDFKLGLVQFLDLSSIIKYKDSVTLLQLLKVCLFVWFFFGGGGFWQCQVRGSLVSIHRFKQFQFQNSRIFSFEVEQFQFRTLWLFQSGQLC